MSDVESDGEEYEEALIYHRLIETMNFHDLEEEVRRSEERGDEEGGEGVCTLRN